MTAPPVPDFLRPLTGADTTDLNVSAYRPPRGETSAEANRRQSAVLILVCGTTPENSAIIIEERAHTMRAQPGQFALPGGRKDPGDPTIIHTALREAREEIGLDLDALGGRILGCGEGIDMTFRNTRVVPVMAWAASEPSAVLRQLTPEKAEVEAILAAPLCGEGSLTDPRVYCRAYLENRPVGIGFDLPTPPGFRGSDAFIWGFTAAVIGGFLHTIFPTFQPELSPLAKYVPISRLQGEPTRGQGR